MRLISGNQLLPRFKELVGQARRVDIAVAWAKPCDAVEVLARGAASGTRIRIAVGLSMNGTKPETLLRLQEFAKLRIALPRCGIFHPKFYSFRAHDGDICWIGSSNLTAGGFGGNVELVCEYDDDGEGQRWFRALWNGDDLDRDSEPAIAAYIEDYVPPKPCPRPQYRGDAPRVVPLGDQAPWRDFVEGLRTRDDYFRFHGIKSPRGFNLDVLGEPHSYFHTIARGREVAHLEDWVHMGLDECGILTGKDTDDGTWGLLGTFFFTTRSAFADGTVRGAIHELVQPVLDVPDDEIVPVNVAHDAVQAIREIHQFGPAAATRLVTLTRPDCLVSVNAESAAGLGKLSDVAYTADDLANDYAELVTWVHEQSWFNAPEPDDPLEREIWNSRAALLDPFVYPWVNPGDG